MENSCNVREGVLIKDHPLGDEVLGMIRAGEAAFNAGPLTGDVPQSGTPDRLLEVFPARTRASGEEVKTGA